MTVFQALDDYLGQEYSTDYWSDEAILHAFALVREMIPMDWESLKATWQARPRGWQYRCAEVLAQADPQQAIPLLLDMLHTPDSELTVTAADVLRTLQVGQLHTQVSPQVAQRLHTLARDHPGPIAQTIHALLECLRVTV